MYRSLFTIAVALLLFRANGACAADAPDTQAARDLNLQGIQLQSKGDLPAAAECYRKALKLNPAGAAYHNNLALVSKDLEQLDAAEQEERQALKLRPKRADYHCNLGIILQREKKLEAAEQELREACTLEALDTESHYRLAQVLKEEGKFDAAEREIKLALMLKPDQLTYHQLYGDILFQQKRNEEAMNEYNRVATASSGNIAGDVRAKMDYLRQVLRTH